MDSYILPALQSEQLANQRIALELFKVTVFALVAGAMATLNNSICNTPNGVLLREKLGVHIWFCSLYAIIYRKLKLRQKEAMFRLILLWPEDVVRTLQMEQFCDAMLTLLGVRASTNNNAYSVRNRPYRE